MELCIVPLSLKEANEYITKHHRHHKKVQGHKFSLGLQANGRLIGVCTVGRPVARKTNHKEVVEVTRLCTDGMPNACSILYGAAARVAREMGYLKIQTFILEDEFGISLKASGWAFECTSRGGQWVHTDGKARRTDQPICPKRKYSKTFKKNIFKAKQENKPSI